MACLAPWLDEVLTVMVRSPHATPDPSPQLPTDPDLRDRYAGFVVLGVLGGGAIAWAGPVVAIGGGDRIRNRPDPVRAWLGNPMNLEATKWNDCDCPFDPDWTFPGGPAEDDTDLLGDPDLAYDLWRESRPDWG